MSGLPAPSYRRIGYIRTDTPNEAAAQAPKLLAAGCVEIRQIETRGARAWPETLVAGEIVVVVSLSVLGPPMREVVRRVKILLDGGMGFQAMDDAIVLEPGDHSAPAGVFRGLGNCAAAWERRRIEKRKRTQQSEQRRAGRKPKLGDPDQQRILAMVYAPEARVSEVARALGIGRTTLYRYLRDVANRGQERGPPST